MSSNAPEREYKRRLETWSSEAGLQASLARRVGNARLAVAVAGAGLTYFVFGRVWISPYWLIPPAVIFVALVIWHSRVFQKLAKATRAVRFYERGLARVEDRWAGTGEQGNRFRDPAHVYSDDLDLFGKGGLFELISTTRTNAGEDTLARWLLAPGTFSEIVARQKAVVDLRPDVDLRERMALLGEDFRSEIKLQALDEWAARPPVRFPPGVHVFTTLLSAATLIAFTVYMAGGATRTPFLAFLLVQSIVAFTLLAKVREVINAVDSPARDLALLAEILRLIEQRAHQDPVLAGIRSRLEVEHSTASARIDRLEGLVDKIEWEHNPFFTPIAALLFWSTHLAVRVEAWRCESGAAIRRWLETAAEFEAVSALAGYSYEHPDDPFPQLIEGSPHFEAQELRHPLIPRDRSVPNDVAFSAETALLIISGSNMSGKSTLLRTVGLNTVLAWAGAPVRAGRMIVSPLHVGASIRIVDSLQDGKSRFYAEIKRLRQIVDLADRYVAQPDHSVLFLIDELLSGTNSHDRRIGAEAIVKALVERGAIGLITTHDLALVHIAEALPGRAVNLHFEDTLEPGGLHFDYRLRPGVVQRSNALELMRSVGLPL